MEYVEQYTTVYSSSKNSTYMTYIQTIRLQTPIQSTKLCAMHFILLSLNDDRIEMLHTSHTFILYVYTYMINKHIGDFRLHHRKYER